MGQKAGQKNISAPEKEMVAEDAGQSSWLKREIYSEHRHLVVMKRIILLRLNVRNALFGLT